MAKEPGRTGRRIGGEAPPSERPPEEEAPVGEGEAEPAVTEGVYFSKVSGRDVWHAHDEDHDHIGTVYKGGERWHVKASGQDMPAQFGSAASARAFLSGYHLGLNAGHEQAADRFQQMQTHVEGVKAELRRDGEAKTKSTDASHDADAT